jgi:carbon dioxide concentrating mechanism protein CcmN
MNLLPAMPPTNRPAVISGDVEVHPTASIANGVLLQADPGSQIVIGAGACIGCGCILHAQDGILSIEDGAVLGVGVLVFGASRIGTQACIGSASSVVDGVIAPHTMLPANAWIHARSSSLDLPVASSAPTPFISAEPPAAPIGPTPLIPAESPASPTGPTPLIPAKSPASPTGPKPLKLAVPSVPRPEPTQPAPPEIPQPREVAPPPPTIPTAPVAVSLATPIYGKVGLKRLLATLRNEKPDLS